MDYPAFYKHMSELLMLIKSNLGNENAHAIVVLNDYMLLKGLYAEYEEVKTILPLVEEKIKRSEDWEFVKETYVPSLDEESKELIKNLL